MATNNRKIGQDNYDKGIELEKKFCEYMKTALGYKEGRIRAQVKSDLNNRGVNVDIVIRRNSKTAKYYNLLGVISFVGLLLLALYACYHPDIIIAVFAVLYLIMEIVFFVLSEKYKYEYAWVECKNQIDPVNNEQMQTTLTNYNGYVATKRRKYFFSEQYFVSASGFSTGALELAEAKKILCYIYKNGNFELVPYWN